MHLIILILLELPLCIPFKLSNRCMYTYFCKTGRVLYAAGTKAVCEVQYNISTCACVYVCCATTHFIIVSSEGGEQITYLF